ncbi:MAG: hypothetical protein NZ585_14645 [Chloracidobacterium sp.]|nr:hypothetical protein [Chloracidobacterium sp.]MDW8216653.1 hypothetical protein [Acidobacteriota bacterium]
MNLPLDADRRERSGQGELREGRVEPPVGEQAQQPAPPQARRRVAPVKVARDEPPSLRVADDLTKRHAGIGDGLARLLHQEGDGRRVARPQRERRAPAESRA